MAVKLRTTNVGPKPKKKEEEKEKQKKSKAKTKGNTKQEYGGSTDTKLGGDEGEAMPPITEFEKNVLEYIIGQDEAVRKIITAIYRARTFQEIKSNVLIIGKSGTGKTATIKQVARMLDIPYTIEDATKYTQEGYYGSDVIEMVYNLIDNADHDLEKAWNGIIVVDEIDKKSASDVDKDVAGAEVLKSMLKIIEGTTVLIEPTALDPEDYKSPPIPFDTDSLIIICMGAFPGLDKIRDKRLNRNATGFAVVEAEAESSTKFLKKDLIEYGLPEEFVGRIDTIVEMNDLGINELARILTQSKLSIFRKYEEEFERLGIKLEYDKKLFREIAKLALNLDTGARELSNVVNYIFEKITYDVLAHPGKYKKCKLEKGIAQDNTRYTLL